MKAQIDEDDGYNSFEEVDDDDLGDDFNASDEEQEISSPPPPGVANFLANDGL